MKSSIVTTISSVEIVVNLTWFPPWTFKGDQGSRSHGKFMMLTVEVIIFPLF